MRQIQITYRRRRDGTLGTMRVEAEDELDLDPNQVKNIVGWTFSGDAEYRHHRKVEVPAEAEAERETM